MSEGSPVSKVTPCIQVLKWYWQPRVGIEIRIFVCKTDQTQIKARDQTPCDYRESIAVSGWFFTAPAGQLCPCSTELAVVEQLVVDQSLPTTTAKPGC